MMSRKLNDSVENGSLSSKCFILSPSFINLHYFNIVGILIIISNTSEYKNCKPKISV